MKQTGILLLLIALIGVSFAVTNDVELKLVHHKAWERAEQSCPKNTNYDYFWDNQKCEVCMNDCMCETYLGCTKCAPGYGRLFHKHHAEDQPSAACYKCNSSEGDIIEDCCFMVSTPITSDTSPLQTHNVSAMRAHKCFETIRQKYTAVIQGTTKTFYVDTKVFQGGAVCHIEDYCANYNEYGRCTECVDRYYIGSDHKCHQCLNDCKKCSGEDTCLECYPGYYIPRYWYQRENVEGSEGAQGVNFISLQDKNPHQCAKCSDNCLCSENSPNLCDSCISNYKFYFDEVNKRCAECEKSDSKTCTSCPKGICSGCIDGYILDTTSNPPKCVECPLNCAQCELDTTVSPAKAYCKEEGCHNGYLYTAKEKNCSTKCGPNQARCKLTKANEQNLMESVPTQCQQDAVSSQSGLSSWGRIRSKLPIKKNDYFLIEQTIEAEGGNKVVPQCLDNSVLKCKTMKSPLPVGQSAYCTECYKQFGYRLTPNTKRCVTCEVEQCIQCDFLNGADDLTCTKCIDKRNLEKDYRGTLDANQQNYVAIGGKCDPCTDGCLSCNEGKQCTPGNCQNGYRNNSDTTCEICERLNCKKCDADVKNCTECFDGFRLWKPTGEGNDGINYCESCEANCLSCQSDRKVCTRCKAGYYLFSGICRESRQNCASIHIDGSCEYCNYGYRNVQGFCYSCYEEGYYNCPVGCGVQKYVRDGDVLTKKYYDEIMNGKTQYQMGSLLQVSAAILVFVLATLI